MSKAGAYEQGPPPYPPPSYSQAVGVGVQQQPPMNPYLPGTAIQQGQPAVQTIVTTVIPVGPDTTRMICPHCHAEIMTHTSKEPGMIAYISGFVIALLGGWLGCCLIPCCINECMDVHHSCPNCKAYLGRYQR